MVMMTIMMMVMMMMMMMMMPLHCKTIVDQFFLQFLDCICICICICVFLYLCQNHWTDDGSCFHAIQWPHPTSEHLLCFLCIFLTGQPCRDRLILPLFLKEKHIDTCFIIWWWWCIFVFLHFLYFCVFCIFCIFVFFVFFVFLYFCIFSKKTENFANQTPLLLSKPMTASTFGANDVFLATAPTGVFNREHR